MTWLVLQAHPVPDSYNAALLARVHERVVAAGDEAHVVRVGQGDRLSVDDLRAAKRLTAVYPTWWGSPPAMLLAELARVLGRWIDGNATRATSPLNQVVQLTAVTTHGSPRRTNLLQGEPGQHLWKRSVLPLCAPGATFEWQALYGMDAIDDAGRDAFLATL